MILNNRSCPTVFRVFCSTLRSKKLFENFPENREQVFMNQTHGGKRESVHNKKLNQAKSQWLMFVIPATQEVEIRRIVVRSQRWANSLQDPILKTPITQKGQ
jgi:hypothetical protein